MRYHKISTDSDSRDYGLSTQKFSKQLIKNKSTLLKKRKHKFPLKKMFFFAKTFFLNTRNHRYNIQGSQIMFWPWSKHHWKIFISEKNTDPCANLKGQCHEIFDLYFFSLIEPIWSPDKQAKMVFLKNSFSRRYSNLKFKKNDSAQANTARSRFFSKLAL